MLERQMHLLALNGLERQLGAVSEAVLRCPPQARYFHVTTQLEKAVMLSSE